MSPTTGGTIDLDGSMASAATFEDGDVTTSDDLGATASDGTFAGFVADLFSAASAPVDGDQGQTVPATARAMSGAAPASAQAFAAPARDTDGDGDVDADDEIAAATPPAPPGANEPLELDEDVEISTELLMRLTSELYPRLRSRLRTELLIDRERAGLLTDLRYRKAHHGRNRTERHAGHGQPVRGHRRCPSGPQPRHLGQGSRASRSSGTSPSTGSGEDWNYFWSFPGNAKYSNIKLERPSWPRTPTRVQEWLEETSKKYVATSGHHRPARRPRRRGP